MAWCHVMAHICRGKNIANLDQALLQTGACRKNPRGFDRETCPLVGQTIITPSSSLVFSSIRNTKERDIRTEL